MDTKFHKYLAKSDLIQLYNKYLVRSAANQFPDNNPIQVEDDYQIEGANNVLIVIDMQNDFLDYEMKGLGTSDNRGAFAVLGSRNIVDKIDEFIFKNVKKFSKIIFSRDFHDPHHCTFWDINESNKDSPLSPGSRPPPCGPTCGPFPPHCIMNSLGAQLHETFVGANYRSLMERGKMSIIFKGMKKNEDSFSAFEYSDMEYASSRQYGPTCCQTIEDSKGHSMACSNLTGGWKRTDKNTYLDLAQVAFPNAKSGDNVIDQCTQINLADLGITEVTENVYIIGLAGDFCVADTAISIADVIGTKKDNGFKAKVKVLQEFVRYSGLPLFAQNKAITNVDEANYTSTKQKPLNQYIFEQEETFRGPIYTLVPKEGVLDAYQLAMAGWPDKITKGIISSDNRKYKHFITDPADILTKYSSKGIKILIPSREILQKSVAGGKKTKKIKKIKKIKKTKKVKKVKKVKKFKKIRKIRKTKKVKKTKKRT